MRAEVPNFHDLILAGFMASVSLAVIADSPSSNIDQAAIRARLDAMVDACNREDLEAYAGGFDPHRRDSVLRSAGILFTQHAVHMELEDAHVISAKKDVCEVAVKYTLSLTEHEFKILSVLHMKRTHGDWFVQRESILSFEEPRRSAAVCVGGGCGRLGGGCPIRSSCPSGGCGSGAW